jgi:hypothetical protein
MNCMILSTKHVCPDAKLLLLAYPKTRMTYFMKRALPSSEGKRLVDILQSRIVYLVTPKFDSLIP